MSDHAQEDEVLAPWCRRLGEALGIADLEVDVEAILGLAGEAAHAVQRPAAPLTTFLVGYAAGRAAGGEAGADAAIRSARETALRLCQDAAAGSPAES